jgi:hypothetical protein
MNSLQNQIPKSGRNGRLIDRLQIQGNNPVDTKIATEKHEKWT